MALTAADIETVRSTVGHIQQANSSIQNDSQTFKYVLENSEMEKMISGTEAGQSAEEKITKALEGVGHLTSSLDELKSRTEKFLARQEEINNTRI